MAVRGTSGFLIVDRKIDPPPRGSSPAHAKGSLEMKAIVMLAAVLTSAMLTVPTVSQAADTKASELRLNA